MRVRRTIMIVTTAVVAIAQPAAAQPVRDDPGPPRAGRTAHAWTPSPLVLARVRMATARSHRGHRRRSLRTLVRHAPLRAGVAAALTDCSAQYGGPFACGSIQVPTAAGDPSLGTRTIDFVYRPADVQPARGTTMFGNGPIQSTFSDSSPWKPGFFSWQATGQGAQLATRDVILVNTRGTGRDASDCPLLQSYGNDVGTAVAECAGILGRSIDYFTAGDSADDLEAVRSYLLGPTRRIDLVSTGHNTMLAEAYLARYPRRVHTAVLDEAANINAWSDVEVKESTAILDRICRRSERCAPRIDATTPLVAWLADQVRRSPIVGTTTLADGTPQVVRIDEPSLVWGLVFGNGTQTFAKGAGLAAAIVAYRHGDSAPLLRLAANAGIGDGTPQPILTNPDNIAEEWSAPGFAAASCNEWPTAYDLTADETTRRAQAVERLAAQPADLYGIFSHALYSASTWEECWSWPAPARQNRIYPPGVAHPSVPVLVLGGDLNADHPQAAARVVASRYPNATFVVIPRGSQPSLSSSACAARIAARFVDTGATGSTRCSATEGSTVLGIGDFPRTAADETPARRASSADRSTLRDRKAAAVAVYTWLDALGQAWDAGADAGPALRGGTWSVAYGPDEATWTFDGARFAEDVAVSGTAHFGFSADNAPADLTVSGAGTAAGTLHVEDPAIYDLTRPTAHVTGTLGGRTIDLVVDLH